MLWNVACVATHDQISVQMKMCLNIKYSMNRVDISLQISTSQVEGMHSQAQLNMSVLISD